jgi:hypothetical protein
MKHVRRAAAMALVLAATPVALAVASGGPSGTYVTTVTNIAGLKGTYRITFTPGRFVIHAPYGIVGRGTDTISGSRMTLHGPGECKAAGTYQFTISGTSLKFRKIKDSCPRAAVLTAHPLKKV